MNSPEGFAAKDRRPKDPHWIWGLVKSPTIIKFLLLSIVSILIIGFLVLPHCKDMVVVVEPITLPASIGYSSEVFTDEMVSESQRLLGMRRDSGGKLVHTMATLEPECLGMRPFLGDLKSDYLRDFSYSIRFERKRDKNYYEQVADTVAYYLEDTWLFPRKSVSVRGEIIPDGDLFNLRLTATFSWGNTYSSTKILGQDKKLFAKRAGHELIKFAAPWVYVSTRIFNDLRNGVEASVIVNKEFKRNNQALNQSMIGFAFLYSGKVSEASQNLGTAEKSFGEALDRSPETYWALIGRAQVESTLYFYPMHGPKRAIQWDAFNRIQTLLQRKYSTQKPLSSREQGSRFFEDFDVSFRLFQKRMIRRGLPRVVVQRATHQNGSKFNPISVR